MSGEVTFLSTGRPKLAIGNWCPRKAIQSAPYRLHCIEPDNDLHTVLQPRAPLQLDGLTTLLSRLELDRDTAVPQGSKAEESE